jgi:undecaprenyl-diphosphatase
MNLLAQLDTWLFLGVNQVAGRWLGFDTLARLFLNDYFVPTLMAIILLALWFEGKQPAERFENQKAVLVGSLSAALANALLKVINLFYYRPRPFALYDVNLLFYQPTDSSLPSNAAALGFAIAAGVWFQQRRWGWLLVALAALFGLSRVFGGVHYPLDVLAGVVLGCLSAWLIQNQRVFVHALLALILKLSARLFGL